MSDFKEFLSAIAAGKNRRDLFLHHTRAEMQTAIAEMCDEANGMGLWPIFQRAHWVVVFGNSFAKMRVAHNHIDETMRGLVWSGVHGLECLDGFERSAEIRRNLLARVREF